MCTGLNNHWFNCLKTVEFNQQWKRKEQRFLHSLVHLPRTATWVRAAVLSRAVWAEHEYTPWSSTVTLDIVKLAPSIIILPGKKWVYGEDETNRNNRNVILSKLNIPHRKQFKEELKKKKNLSHNAHFIRECHTWKLESIIQAHTNVYKPWKGSGWLAGWFLNYQIQPSVIHGSVMEASCLVCLKSVPYTSQ